MIFPLEKLIQYEKNMYEVTVASSRRSYQLSMLYAAQDGQARYHIDTNDGKVVSLAAKEIFTKEIDFILEKE